MSEQIQWRPVGRDSVAVGHGCMLGVFETTRLWWRRWMWCVDSSEGCRQGFAFTKRGAKRTAERASRNWYREGGK